MSSPYLYHDGAKVSRESELGKELAKWERKPDWRPENNPYPRMLYRAEHRPDGRRSVGEVLDSLFGGAPGAAEQWSRRCQLTVHSEAEQARAMEQGWRTHPREALEYLEARDKAVEVATAERHYADARMSELAQREAKAIDQSTLKHVPSIPEAHVDGRSKAAREAKKAKEAAKATQPAG
jgi:hypothetical protein